MSESQVLYVTFPRDILWTNSRPGCWSDFVQSAGNDVLYVARARSAAY
jgi:hypothetical protein